VAAEQLLRWEDAACAFYEAYLLDPSNKEWERRFRHAISEGQAHARKQRQTVTEENAEKKAKANGE
jgi:hypothetical protein